MFSRVKWCDVIVSPCRSHLSFNLRIAHEIKIMLGPGFPRKKLHTCSNTSWPLWPAERRYLFGPSRLASRQLDCVWYWKVPRCASPEKKVRFYSGGLEKSLWLLCQLEKRACITLIATRDTPSCPLLCHFHNQISLHPRFSFSSNVLLLVSRPHSVTCSLQKCSYVQRGKMKKEQIPSPLIIGTHMNKAPCAVTFSFSRGTWKAFQKILQCSNLKS